VNGGESITFDFGTDGLTRPLWLVFEAEQRVETILVRIDTVGDGQAAFEISQLTFVRDAGNTSAPNSDQKPPIEVSITPRPPATGGGAGIEDGGSAPWVAGSVAALLLGAVLVEMRRRTRS
jgi:hypothetical protein